MTFSVIIPTRNRQTLLKQSLEGLFKQEYADAEIIVVNDGSTDATDEVLSQFAALGRIQYYKQTHRGPAAARNMGALHASGRYLAFTDDDCVVPVDWLRRISEIFGTRGAQIVGGTVRNCIENNIYSQVSQESVNHFVSELNKNGRTRGFLTSNNIAYDAEAFKAAGGFDEQFHAAGGEERALNARIILNGGASVLVPDLIVEHYHTMTAGSFFRQQRNYGRGSFILHHRAGKELPPTAIPASVYTTLITSWLGKGIFSGLKKLTLFFAGQAMVVLGFISEAISPGSAGATSAVSSQ